MKIIVDTLGADTHPAEIVKGGIEAAYRYDIEILFAGESDSLRKIIKEKGEHKESRFSILPASQIITMEESPVQAVRSKRDSSLVKGLRALRTCEADGFVSPGNTGAVVAGAIFTLGGIPRIPRPGIAASFPSLIGDDMLVIDVGATVDSHPNHLVGFALMGSLYCQSIKGIAAPTVGLLNIGGEKHKGNRLVSRTYELLEKGPFKFAGNIEPHCMVTERPVDIVVCDGFVGNILLKAYEGGAAAVIGILQQFIKENFIAKLGAIGMQAAFTSVRAKMDYRSYGGASLLGVDGVVVIAHGRSNAEAITAAINVARLAVQNNLTTQISNNVGEVADE
ncbi:phosphate acyltransferase PlsX [Candidatus Acetothermia bacterium]|jgi:glycerol-3-phosphate acyltransferase PlsX|nr:phosphate acyltransferase PlsX [Candidatus Acetothermia bacterium]MCI2427482.1 phosphate acyltransferase PlsX [Candidatus Acetothermia bacterium]MCI2428461.1 phosphate acyltransferase PlsX [Candidatus Acetothermia bacterium]